MKAENIKTMNDLVEFINEQSQWSLEVEKIIERNGWVNDCGEDCGVCHDDKGNKVIINDNGEAEYI